MNIYDKQDLTSWFSHTCLPSMCKNLGLIPQHLKNMQPPQSKTKTKQPTNKPTEDTYTQKNKPNQIKNKQITQLTYRRQYVMLIKLGSYNNTYVYVTDRLDCCVVLPVFLFIFP